LLLSGLLVGSLTGLYVSVKKNIELLEKIEEFQEAVEVCLDSLELQHQIIESKTKIELFSDEPVVRSLVQDIAIAKMSVLEVAKVLDETIKNEEI
jgi:hypothetical protein